MGLHNSRKTMLGYGYLDAILVVTGQAAVVLPIRYEELPVYFIFAGIALGAAGLGLRARRTGRSVLSWVLAGLFFPVLIPLLALVFMLVRGLRQTPAAESVQAGPANIYIHVSIALAMFLISVFVMNSLSLAIIYVLAAVIWVASRGKGRYSRKTRWALIGIYVLALAMVAGMKAVNYRISHANARIIIAACDSYKEKKGEFPAELADLVPDYLPEVPPARYTMMSGGFYYHRDTGPSEKGYRLIFVNEAPFARMVYNSARRDWHGID